MMASALLQADCPIFTSDNPRSENPDQILDEMLAGVANAKGQMEKVEVIADRRLAIKRAIELAEESDVVAILGKGHEIGQEIAGTKYPFDDRLVVAEAIAGLK
jgi:UDP-N-acetylmuramoyl-L-alanyl-D-glutamate--2,6-diaminopimelate ligase